VLSVVGVGSLDGVEGDVCHFRDRLSLSYVLL
jgi:hypothetical protein